MKKLLVLALVLSLASMANAALTIGPSAPTVNVGDAITITLDAGADVLEQGGIYLGILTTSAGDASFNIDNAVINYIGNTSSIAIYDDGGDGTAESLGLRNLLVFIDLSDLTPVGQTPPPVTGLLVSGISFTGVTAGMVDLVALNGGDLSVMASAQVLVPEPITVGLLSLGALFLRRRK